MRRSPPAGRCSVICGPCSGPWGWRPPWSWGPGWGSYTLDLAALCREVACVDLSRDVLDFVLRAGAERGFHNLRAYHAKWEEFTPERTYDLVFGYNCFYRQGDLADCFARMTRRQTSCAWRG